jgi:hypothetical protein
MPNQFYVAVLQEGTFYDITVEDNYGEGQFTLEGQPPKDNLELLKQLLAVTVKDVGAELALSILNDAFNKQKGIFIRNEFFGFEEIKSLFEAKEKTPTDTP